MDSAAIQKDGTEVLKYIADFWDTLRERQVLYSVTPGYLSVSGVLPAEAPIEPENVEDVLKDVDKLIMPGLGYLMKYGRTDSPYAALDTFPKVPVIFLSEFDDKLWYFHSLLVAHLRNGIIEQIQMTQWHHPHFFAYFPATCSYPSILADMLCGALACMGFTWNSSPACTELEIVMMNWLGRLLQLPTEFLNLPGQNGGGIIQGTASEATLVAVLAARTMKLKAIDPDSQFLGLIDKLVCYCSEHAHSSVERATMIGHVKVRQLPTDERYSLRGATLLAAIREDRKNGLIPFCVVATIGTTCICSYDNLKEIGEVCNDEVLWFHIDAAYAGSAAICPEHRHIIDGVELADSFNFNPHKWLMVNFDCSAMWMKDCYLVADAFNVDPLYLKHKHEGEVIDFRHLQIPLGRRFRSLKLWFVLRLLGVKKLQDNIRQQIDLAKEFEKMVRGDSLYEIIGEVTMGLVCFRLKMSNEVNQELSRYINEDDRRIHITPSQVGSTYFLRLAICSTKTNLSDVEFAWKVIQECAQVVLKNAKTASGKVERTLSNGSCR